MRLILSASFVSIGLFASCGVSAERAPDVVADTAPTGRLVEGSRPSGLAVQPNVSASTDRRSNGVCSRAPDRG